MINKQNITGLLAATLLLGITSCGTKNTYTLTGTLPDDSANGKTVYLIDYNVDKPVDSTSVSGNTFTFTGTIQADSIRRIDIAETRYYANFILEPGTIKLELTQGAYKPSGTAKNDLFAQMEEKQNASYAAYPSLRKKLDADSTLTAEMKQEKLNVALDSLQQNLLSVMSDYATQYPNTAISLYAIWNMLMLDPESKNLETTKALAEKDLYAPNFLPVKNLLKKGTQMLLTSEGKPFVDFTAENGKPEGGKVSLSDYVGKGKFILVDFWASWCGPCKAEMPNIKKVYEKFKGEKFDVLSVAVWEDREASLQGIQEHGMTWNQIVGAPETATNLYGINGIPHIILFAPDGTILKRGLRGEEMETAIKEALSKK